MKYLNNFLNVPIVLSKICILILLLPIRHAECRKSKWMCDDGFSCINIYDKCDGELHCPDGSDEIAAHCFNTTQCPQYSFQCSYGGCISGKRECDGHQDCADNSDELLCGKTKLIDLRQNCSSSGEMQCLTSKQCISVTDVCDGRANCADTSDESVAVCGTQQSCGKGYRCAYGACVSGQAPCNGTTECYDGSDEAWEMCNYPRKFKPLTTTVVTNLKLLKTMVFRLAPTPEGLPCKKPKDSSGVNIKTPATERPYFDESMVDVTVITKCVAKKSTTRDLLCQNGEWFGEFPKCNVKAECPKSKWMCDDGFSCINIYDKCDGELHCPDGSDEIAANCFNTTQCPDYSFQCSYGGCISGKRECDDHQDCADNSDELLCEKNKLTDLQQSCSSSIEMQCLTSKQCISVTDVCDGRANCADASDESVAVCGRQQSCGKGYRCAYGACVSGQAPCNGTTECYDGSDEAWEMCNYPRKFKPLTTTVATTLKPPTTIAFPSRMAPPPEGEPCEIPKHLSGVNIKSRATEEPFLPGSMVDDDVTVIAECAAKKDTARDLLCQDGMWFGEFPKCNVYCSVSELEGLSTSHKCTLYGTEDINLCSGSVVTNTTITFHCAYGYIKTEVRSSQEISCLPEGRYDKPRRLCKQNCGILSAALDKLTKNAYPIKPSRSPWHVAIFRADGDEQTQICGGSIISPRLIVSAAHCFWNISERTSPHLYRIAAGKLTNKYVVNENEGRPQIREVQRIYISDDYNDETDNYYADIAILKLKKPLHYNVNISSVCLHARTYDNRDNVGSGISGSITGYGRTGLLERLTMTTISSNECGILPGGKSLANDKFCLNNPNLNSTICKGDSGGGFVEYINGAFYLLGVVSSTPVTQHDCVAAAFVGMSNMRFIRPELYATMMKEQEDDKKLF